MSVVVYYGEEDYLLEQAAQELRNTIVDPAMASLCHKVYSQPDLADVLEAVGSVCMALGGRTLIEIRDFALLTQASKDTATDKQLDELRALLENGDPHKTLFFVSKKIDGKIKFAKWLTQHAHFTVQKFEPFKFWETDKVIHFVLRYAKTHDTNLTEEAAELLVQNIGSDLRSLANEVDKLALFARDRGISLEDVQRISNHNDNLFELIGRWMMGHMAARQFAELSETLLRRHPIEILAAMQGYFNTIFRVLWLYHRGTTVDTIAHRTGQKPFTIKKYLGQYGRIPLPRLMHLKHQLIETEWRVKTGQMEGQLALETLLSG